MSTYLDDVQRRARMVLKNAYLTPQSAMQAVLATVFRECDVTASTRGLKPPSSFQPHEFIKVLVSPVKECAQRHILKSHQQRGYFHGGKSHTEFS